MELLDQIKAELRITHSELDDLLMEQVGEAIHEMIRMGVPTDAFEGDNRCTVRCVKDYVLAQNTEGEKSDKYMEAFKYEADNLRKTDPSIYEDFPTPVEVNDGE